MEIPQRFGHIGQETRLEAGDRIVFNRPKRYIAFVRNGVSLSFGTAFDADQKLSFSFGKTEKTGDILAFVLKIMRLLTPFETVAVPVTDDSLICFELRLPDKKHPADEGTDILHHPAFR